MPKAWAWQLNVLSSTHDPEPMAAHLRQLVPRRRELAGQLDRHDRVDVLAKLRIPSMPQPVSPANG
jgi:hypothetical protein